MKKILSVILGLVAMTSLYAANTEVARLTLTGQGGVENSYITLRVDPTVTTAQTGAFFQNTDLDGNVNIYIKDGANKYSSYKKDDLTNLPLVIITNRRDAADQHYTITFNVPTSTVGLKLYDLAVAPTTPIDITNGDTYEFDVNTTLHPDYVAGTNYTINNRFVINYYVPTVQLFNEWDDNWATPLNFTDNYDGTVSASKTFTGNGYCPFKIVENGNWLGNGDAFKRDYTAATGIGDGANMTLWVDVPGDYTFTWDFMANALSITMPALPTVQMKGSWDSWADFVDFTPATDGLTASAVLNLDPADWYQFKVALNGTDWRSFDYVDDASAFTRANNSHNWINADHTDNMTINADQAGDYTFTWTYVENKLTITFPAVAPALSVTTNGYGFCSFASSENVEFAAGIEAYKGEYNAGTNELTLTSIGQIVPAGTGVILYSASTNTVFNYTTGADASGVTVGTNNFVGVTTAADPAGIRTAGKEIYCLNGNALKQYVGTDEIPAGKAYLPISVGGGPNPAPKHIVMRFNNTTAVDNVEVEVKAEKFVEGGQIYIRRGNEVFNLQGQIVK